MDDTARLRNRIQELEGLLELAERKSDILTNLLKEATVEFEQALERVSISESNFRAIFENAPETIYILDIDTWKILDCNRYTTQWLGYSREELLTMTADDILAPGAVGVAENIRRAVNEGYVYVRERRYRKKDGTVVDAEVTGTMVQYEGKARFVALVRDITERKQIEALSRYKELFENVSDPVFINDVDGRFLEANDEACDRLGYSRRELLRKNIRELMGPDQESRFDEETERRMRNGQTVRFEVDLLNRSGDRRAFEIHGRSILYRRVPAVLSVARDIQIRKRMEATLIKSERLAALGEMAGGVAHNFNNLLQMIMGAGEAALKKLNAGRIRESGEAIRNIVSSAERGTDMVRRIRDFTVQKTDGNGGTNIFDMGELIAEAVQLTRPLWKNVPGGGPYRLNCIRGLGCYVDANPSEIYEVLVNLIKNGLEAMPEGGSLTLSTTIRDGRVRIAVSDRGQGVPATELQRIFEPFYTTKGMLSSGLGLSSSYGIIKKHRGDLHVESTPERGTTFTVTLPLAAHLNQRVPRQLPAERAGYFRILVIDDEVNILRAMEMYFEDAEGIDIRTACGAEKGLDIVYEGGIDAILCDLGMDGMNGWDVGKRVKSYCEDRGMPKIPFLLYTGLIRQLDGRMLEESGVDRVVRKPAAFEELERVLREVTQTAE
jgi:PAS domain S-box-containing protein